MKKKICFIFLLIIPSCLYSDYREYIYGKLDPTYNSLGQIGLIQIPTGENNQEGSIFFTYTDNEIYRFGALSVSPFSWLQASYFYYRPSDIAWGFEGNGNYLDKGFNFKFSKKFFDNTSLALGIDDIAGTGFFSREYIVGTTLYKNYKVTLGLGWGAFADQGGFKNPLSYIHQGFKNRDTIEINAIYDVGNPNLGYVFRGPANVIGGVEFFIPYYKNIRVKIEHDPFNYFSGFTGLTRVGADKILRQKDSNYNFGVSYSISDSLQVSANYIKGNTFEISFAFGANFSKSFFKKKNKKLEVKPSGLGTSKTNKFYEDLIFNLRQKDLYLQSAQSSSGNLNIAISSGKYRNPILIHSIAGEVAADTARINDFNITNIKTTFINAGLELASIETPKEYFVNRQQSIVEIVANNSQIKPGEGKSYLLNSFLPIAKFPAHSFGMTPAVINHVGDPKQFYYGGLILRLDSELQFARGFSLNTILHQNLFNNFDKKSNRPDSQLPHVRTDIVSYLQEMDTTINRMQLDYFFKPHSKEIFGKLSMGLLESMYGGFGFELLYKPFYENFSLSFDLYKVKKRNFNQQFSFLDFETTTGHITYTYSHPSSGIILNLSYGRYLAKDDGFTIDLSRKLTSGFRAGFYFSRTDVPPELFGEGSFDKGFYFQVPIDLFLNDHRAGYINFELKPLTRDGGQKLKVGRDLIGIIHNSSQYELESHWSNFND